MTARFDLHNNIDVTQMLDPVVISGGAATVTGDRVVDMQGAGALEVIANIGASGDTLASNLKLDLKLTHGDLANGSDQAVISNAADVLGTYSTSTGVFATVDDAAEDDAAYKVGYVGIKRYVGVSVVKTGTHTNGTPVAISGIRHHLHRAPSA